MYGEEITDGREEYSCTAHFRRRIPRGLGVVARISAIGTGLAAARGPPEEFPGSDTGEANSEQGRENAADRDNGQGTPPGIDDDNGSGSGTPIGRG